LSAVLVLLQPSVEEVLDAVDVDATGAIRVVVVFLAVVDE
jgi:hypothetical protein